MTTASTSLCYKITVLVLRSFTALLLLASVPVLVTNSKTIHVPLNYYYYQTVKYSFSYFYGYRYMLAVAAIGSVLSLLQVSFSIYSLISKRDTTLLFDFFADKFVSYFILTGSVAGLAVSVDANENLKGGGGIFDKYFGQAFASSALILLAFLCAAIASILSSFALAKRSA